MRKTANIWILIAVLGCMLIAFFWGTGRQNKVISDQRIEYENGRIRLEELKRERITLDNTLKNATSDSFIESTARRKYNYMLRNEIRLVITNTDALYGEQGVPSR